MKKATWLKIEIDIWNKENYVQRNRADEDKEKQILNLFKDEIKKLREKY